MQMAKRGTKVSMYVKKGPPFMVSHPFHVHYSFLFASFDAFCIGS